ncbi:hypothetical protein [Gluconobacter wancherniae]|uniref:hypothetical protein n=1 Tax=Gluconobacter wancherniae TaxID=1307955 RepID=UPI001B8C9E0C|nr:hypothetical protein [Gluconobacter wancherniae]MBS1095896.1 hypothetical protein [Gluconobacter wancherniae]
MSARIGSSDIELHTPVTHAGGSTSTPQNEITGFNDTLHNTAPRPTSSVYSQNSEILHPASVASEHAPAAHTTHTETEAATEEPTAKPAKSKSDQAKDFGDKFDKILKPFTVTLGSTAQIASLISFGQAQEAKNKDSSSNSSTTSDASGNDTSGATGQVPDMAPIPSQQTS